MGAARLGRERRGGAAAGDRRRVAVRPQRGARSRPVVPDIDVPAGIGAAADRGIPAERLSATAAAAAAWGSGVPQQPSDSKAAGVGASGKLPGRGGRGSDHVGVRRWGRPGPGRGIR